MEEGPLVAWIEALLGGEVSGWGALVAGNSRTTWQGVVVSREEALPIVVRTDQGDGPFSATPLSLTREASAYRALQGRGVRIPRLYVYDPERRALVLERVPGRSEWHDDLLEPLLDELATLHALDVETLDLPGFARSALADLELWAGLAATRVHPSSPFVEFAFPYLEAHFPGEPDRLVFLHGDAGPGNILSDGGAVTALLDWELSHLGDPHDDLAFLTVRAGLFGIALPEFASRVRNAYAPRAGIHLDEDRLRYWQAVGVLRNLVTCLASISNPVHGRDRLVHYMLVPALNRLLVSSLARLGDVELEPAEPLDPPRALPGADVIAEVARALSDLLTGVDDHEARQRVKRMRHLLGQIAETWPLAYEIANADEAEGPPCPNAADELRRLGRIADRHLALFPRSRALAEAELPGLA